MSELLKYKVAAVQASPILRDALLWFDLKATLDKTSSIITEAGRNVAKLIVFPECWLPCYPFWSFDLSDRVGFTALWAKYLSSSIEVPSQETETLCAAARNANAYVVIGISERDGQLPGRMYNSIIYLSPSSGIIGIH